MLLAGINSESFTIFIALLFDGDVMNRWTAALIPVRALSECVLPCFVFISAQNFLKISFSSFEDTVFQSKEILLLACHSSKRLRPHLVARLVLSALALSSILFSCSWPRSEFWLLPLSKIAMLKLISKIKFVLKGSYNNWPPKTRTQLWFYHS